jgi:WD40 repeat protein
MSILDKPLSPRPQRPGRRRAILILSIVAGLLIIFFVLTDIRDDFAIGVHFLTAPNHFTYQGHSDYVSAVAWSPDGKRIASGSGDHTVQVWDARDGSHVYIYRGHSSDVSTLAWSPDGKYIASAGLDNTVQVWEAATGKLVYTYRGHGDVVYDVAWSPDGTRIASASNDGTVQVWHAFTGNPILTYKSLPSSRGAPAPWNAVAWSPDGKRIVIGGIGNIEVLDVASGKDIGSYGYNSAIVHALAWSPDGRYIAIGSSTEMVEIWDLVTGQNIFNYRGHYGDVLCVAWSPDGKRIVSGSSDGTAQVWDALTGDNAYTYRGHADYYWGHLTSGASVNSVAWSPDGKQIASGSNDMTVQVWQAR